MNPASAWAAPLWLAAQAGGSLLFGLAFFYLWRQSGIVYFGLWAGAWAAQAGALLFGPGWLGPAPVSLAAFGAFEFALVILLFSGARAGFSGTIRGWRPALKTLVLLPVFVAASLLWPDRFPPAVSAILSAIYVYHLTAVRGGSGSGASVFRAALLGLATVSLYYACLGFWADPFDNSGFWLLLGVFARFTFSALLAFAAMALWMESQSERMRVLASDLGRVRSESLLTRDLDRLTGLLNQAALSKCMDEGQAFAGVVAVCDMDDFKEINDRYGHLAGDEILRNIGSLLKASIRQEDEAFRWGGDEFVILFHNQNVEVARRRMAEIQDRLRGFRLRGHGVLPISFSWGTAEGGDQPLRDVLDQADRSMYAFKRARKT